MRVPSPTNLGPPSRRVDRRHQVSGDDPRPCSPFQPLVSLLPPHLLLTPLPDSLKSGPPCSELHRNCSLNGSNTWFPRSTVSLRPGPPHSVCTPSAPRQHPICTWPTPRPHPTHTPPTPVLTWSALCPPLVHTPPAPHPHPTVHPIHTRSSPGTHPDRTPPAHGPHPAHLPDGSRYRSAGGA